VNSRHARLRPTDHASVPRAEKSSLLAEESAGSEPDDIDVLVITHTVHHTRAAIAVIDDACVLPSKERQRAEAAATALRACAA
jgi:hypothetical protein